MIFFRYELNKNSTLLSTNNEMRCTLYHLQSVMVSFIISYRGQIVNEKIGAICSKGCTCELEMSELFDLYMLIATITNTFGIGPIRKIWYRYTEWSRRTFIFKLKNISCDNDVYEILLPYKSFW